MKKRLISVLLILVLVCSVIPLEAFASPSSVDMTVTYTYTQTTPTFTPEYTINIPASFSINDGEKFVFTANKMNIGDGKKLKVMIDTTYENGGNFQLYKDKGTPDEARIPCMIMVSNPSESIGWTGYSGSDTIVAWFENGNTTPKGAGAIKIVPNVSNNPPSGTYTGTLIFKFEVYE
ncbi:MAG: hypothetical protein ACOY81_11175 [Bacillota bacterium]